MYKFTMLFFFLIAFNSQSLIDTYQLIFENKDAAYTLQVKEGGLIFENQPDVNVKVHNEHTANTSNTKGKIYKIVKGATFEEGLKIGAIAIDDISKIGEIAIDDISKIGAIIIDDVSRIKEDALFKTEDCYAYEIKLDYEFVRIAEQSTDAVQKIEIPENGFYIYIVGNELILFE